MNKFLQSLQRQYDVVTDVTDALLGMQMMQRCERTQKNGRAPLIVTSIPDHHENQPWQFIERP